jgi:hypothetical protein
MSTPRRGTQKGRVALLLAAAGATVGLLFVLAGRIAEVRHLGLEDYVAYWSAGRVNAQGGNPYSPSTLLPLQQELGWSQEFPDMMYYPPWTLALVMPFGLLPFAISRLLWFLVHVGVMLLCADRLWDYYRGPVRLRWLAWLISLAFVPTLIALRMGQIGPVLLLGIVGFLCLEKRGWDGWAGALLALAAIKPQLLYLFGLAVVLWAVDRRRWRVLAGGAAMAVAATGVAWLFNRSVLSDYGYAVAHPPSENITPTLGAVLRLIWGAEHTWLQFVPSLVGVGWLCWYWARRRRTWSWDQQAPMLLLMSFLTTAYGAWVFDIPILLVPVLQATVWMVGAPRRLAAASIVAFILGNGTALALNLAGATYPSFIWMTPVLLVGYLVLGHLSARAPREGVVAAC